MSSRWVLVRMPEKYALFFVSSVPGRDSFPAKCCRTRRIVRDNNLQVFSMQVPVHGNREEALQARRSREDGSEVGE